MKHNLIFIHSVYIVKLLYTASDNIASCYDDTKSKYIISARYLLIDVPSIRHMETISTLKDKKRPHGYSEVTGM